MESLDIKAIGQLARDNDIREDVVEKELYQQTLSWISEEKPEGSYRTLGEGIVGGSDQGDLSRASKCVAEISTNNKGKKSAQVAVAHNTVRDAVTDPAGEQDTINYVGNTVRSVNVTHKDLAIIDKERRTSDSQALIVQGIKECTVRKGVHVGSDLGTQDVVEEEVRQVGEECIVGQESVDNGRRELGERVVVGRKDRKVDILRVENTIKSGAEHSGLESRQRGSRDNALKERQLALGTTEVRLGFLK
jgi:hypothetical protein